MVPALAPFSSWPRGLVRECCPAGRPWTSTSLPRTSNQRPSQHLALFSSAPRGCCTRIWPTVGGSPGPSLPPSSNATHVGSGRPLTTTSRFPSSVPSSRLANGSRDTNLAFTLFSSSTSESDGQLSRPQPVLRCGILCSPVFSLCSFPSISPPVSLLRYGMVGTVAGDGAPRSLSVVRSSGVSWTRPFSFSDSSLVGPRPFSLPLSHPACVVFVALGCHVRYWPGFYLT